ncbi:Uncharacterised protein [Burkholderia pseudomallei]|nr:Uncharacterised protein [Burkholderia pseudomallei]CAJ6702722.1 Uncharacterised protein [Burkholderia pseudomallei]
MVIEVLMTLLVALLIGAGVVARIVSTNSSLAAIFPTAAVVIFAAWQIALRVSERRNAR